jgi:uncharacterized membrane-anchored protein YhcB (DUF1043 family)
MQMRCRLVVGVILGVIVARLANVGFSNPISAIMTDGDKTNHDVEDAETMI